MFHFDTWVEAVKSRDIDRVCSLYAKEAVLWGTIATELASKPEQIRAYFERFLALPIRDVRLVSAHERSVGEFQYLDGIYDFELPEETMRARYTMVVKKDRIFSHHSSALPIQDSSDD